MKSNYVIGADIGTTSTKALLYTHKGEVVAQHSVPYPLLSPTPATAEQDPDEIFSAVIASIRQVVGQSRVDPGEISCLAFSAAMHSLILINHQGKPLSKSITWADNRAAQWATKLKQEPQGEAIYRRTGTPIHPMSPLVKLIWLRHEHPELFGRTSRFISIKEYVFYQLFRRYWIDHSIASATGLLNMEQLDWDPEALELAGVRPDQLSELVPTTHIVQGMAAEYAEETGLPADIPVVIGASDGVLSNLGVGAIAPGVVAVTVGTSGAVRATLDRPKTDPNGTLFCYALTERKWVIGGAINNGGIALRWVRDHITGSAVDTARLLKKDSYDILTEIAQTIPPGSEGLIFHPYLAGERSPLWDANARASFFGLGLHHHKGHLIRAVLEGVVYNLHLVLQALEETIGDAKSIQATGGFARSQLWRQMLADIFNRDVVVPESYESSCFGAAVLGLYALDLIPSLESVSQIIGETHRHQPIAKNVEKYQHIIPVYKRLLDKFQEEYTCLAHMQKVLTDQTD